MRVLETRVYRGPSPYGYRPVIRLTIDLDEPVSYTHLRDTVELATPAACAISSIDGRRRLIDHSTANWRDRARARDGGGDAWETRCGRLGRGG